MDGSSCDAGDLDPRQIVQSHCASALLLQTAAKGGGLLMVRSRSCGHVMATDRETPKRTWRWKRSSRTDVRPWGQRAHPQVCAARQDVTITKSAPLAASRRPHARASPSSTRVVAPPSLEVSKAPGRGALLGAAPSHRAETPLAKGAFTCLVRPPQKGPQRPAHPRRCRASVSRPGREGRGGQPQHCPPAGRRREGRGTRGSRLLPGRRRRQLELREAAEPGPGPGRGRPLQAPRSCCAPARPLPRAVQVGKEGVPNAGSAHGRRVERGSPRCSPGPSFRFRVNTRGCQGGRAWAAGW